MQQNRQLGRRANQASAPLVKFGALQPIQAVETPGFETAERVKYSVFFRRHRRSFMAFLLGSILASLVVTEWWPDTYRARTVLEVMGVNEDFMNSRDLNPNTAVATPDTFIETQTKLLQSESIADRVVAVLAPKLTESDYQQHRGFGGLFRGTSHDESAEPTIRQMLKAMKVKVEGQSSLISVTIDGPSGKIAADTANALGKEYINDLDQVRLNIVSRTGDFLAGQLEGLRRKLEASEDALQQYAQRSGLLYVNTTGATHENVDIDKLKQIQQDLEQARSTRADKQAQYELIRSSSSEALPQVVDDASLRDYLSKLTDLRRQLAELRATLTPKHYKVTQLEGQIKELESAVQTQRNVVLHRIQADYLAAIGREQLRARDYGAQVARVTHQNVQEVRYNFLKREADANRDLYQSMLQKVKEAGVASALKTSNIRVVDPAKTPLTRYQPKVPINLGIGIVLGVFLWVLYALLRERSDQSIRLPGESRRLLDLPELAAIPSAKKDPRIQVFGHASARLAATSSIPSDTKLLAAGDRPELRSILRKCAETRSIVAESFRSAVTSILLWGRYNKQSPVIVVSSVHAKAGKTTAVFNLALGLAESGRRVLMIEGDLRLPRLGQIIGFEGAPGLGDLLSGTLPVSEAASLVLDTGVPGLYVLPCGELRPNVPQLLHSPKLGALVEVLRAAFDFVLIDSPPIIPLTDARLLAKHGDGMILICRAGHTNIDQLLSIRKVLAEDRTVVIGTILNDWNAQLEDPSYLQSYASYARADA